MTTQLKDLKGEIDELYKEIRREKEKRDDTTKSIERLESRLDARSTTRDALALHLAALAAAPFAGKNPPLALDASVPPLHANTPNPPLVVASLSSSTRFKPRFEPRF